MMHEKSIEDREAEQMRELAVLRKLIGTILAKYWRFLLLFFLVCLVLALALIAWETWKSPIRFETRVNLLYFPKKSAKVQSLDDRSLMQIFTRHLMFTKLSDELQLNRKNVIDLIPTVEVSQNRKQTNLYTVIARDNTGGGAIRKANTFADLCIREYMAFRAEDLKKHREVIMQRKISLQDSLRKLRQEETALCQRLLVTSPVDELARLQKIASDLKSMLAEADIKLANEKVKLKGVRTLLKDVNPAVFLHIGKIREFIAELDKLDHELLSARQLYTGLNPRLLALEAHRKAVARQYDDFLKRHAIGRVEQDSLGTMERLNREAAKSEDLILTYAEQRISIVKSLQDNREQTDQIRRAIPDFKNIEDRRGILQETFRMNEEILSELNYLQASLPNEVTQVERSTSVTGTALLAKRNIALALAAALLITALAALAVISLELAFGKVSGGQELSLYPELNLLGTLPERSDLPGGRENTDRAVDSLYYHFQSVSSGDRIIFSGSLPGGEKSAEVEERLEWNCSLSGRRIFRLKLTDLPIPEDENMALVPEAPVRRGNSGFVQVENVYVLRPPEIRLMQNILEKLQLEYDMIIILRDEPLKKSGIFLRQMAQFCDSAILFVGAGSTHRDMLRKLVHFAENHKMKILTVVSGENNHGPLTPREYYDV